MFSLSSEVDPNPWTGRRAGLVEDLAAVTDSFRSESPHIHRGPPAAGAGAVRATDPLGPAQPVHTLPALVEPHPITPAYERG